LHVSKDVANDVGSFQAIAKRGGESLQMLKTDLFALMRQAHGTGEERESDPAFPSGGNLSPSRCHHEIRQIPSIAEVLTFDHRQKRREPPMIRGIELWRRVELKMTAGD
jgi:hypothetical protein